MINISYNQKNNQKNMKKHKCSKCERLFDTNRGLLLHNRQNIDCDIPVDLHCGKCNKLFKTKATLSQHLKRKIPCTSNSSSEEKIKIMELELEIFKEKENIKKNNIIEISEKKENLKKENKIKIFKEEAEIKKELITLKIEKTLEVEKAKTDRKEKTSQVINNIHNDIRNDIKIQQFNNCIVNLNSNGVVNAVSENLTLPLKDFENNTTSKKAIKMVYPPKLNTTLPVDIISQLHGKDAPAEYRNLWYNSELDGFYKVYNKKWEYIKEEDWLIQQIRLSLSGALHILQKNLLHYKSNEDIYYDNHGLFNGYLAKNTDDYYRNLGTRGLSYKASDVNNLEKITYFCESEDEIDFWNKADAEVEIENDEIARMKK